MPVLTSTATGAVDLAGRLVADLEAGRPARQTYGARDAAFAWAEGLPAILARFVNAAVVSGLTFTAVRVKPSATPAAKVAKGATKPDAVAISSEAISLPKYAGLANIATEDTITAEGLVPAIAATLTSSILLAYDADCMAALDAATTPGAAGSSWADAILGGIASVAANGGSPGLLVLSAADYAAAVGSPGVGYAMDPTRGVPTLFGLGIVISSALASGSAYVLDPNACQAVENEASPVAVLDPYSGLSTNAIRLALEAWLGFVVVSPGSVAAITGPTGA